MDCACLADKTVEVQRIKQLVWGIGILNMSQACSLSPGVPPGWGLSISLHWSPCNSISTLLSCLLSPSCYAEGPSYIYIYMYIFFFLIWRIIALQYYVGFCHTSTWVSHRYTHGPSSWTSLPPPIPPHRVRCHRVSDLSSLHLPAHFHLLSNCTYGNARGSMLLFQFFPPS